MSGVGDRIIGEAAKDGMHSLDEALRAAIARAEAAEARALQAEAACVDAQVFAAEWLGRAYHALSREGWEPGQASEEVRDDLCAVLANLGADPADVEPPTTKPTRWALDGVPGAPLLDALRLCAEALDVTGACIACGAEPGCNIDCKACTALATIRKVLP